LSTIWRIIPTTIDTFGEYLFTWLSSIVKDDNDNSFLTEEEDWEEAKGCC
jgi:hypothetical protein